LRGVAYLEPNKVHTLKRRFFQKVKRIADTYDPRKLPTEELRGEIILNHRELLEIAHREAKSKGRYGAKHQKWSKLAAYISKCINVIMRDYDAVKIKAQLEELKELVYNELLRDRETGN